MSAHTCHALACEASVPPRLHMCPRHWRMVPRRLQSALWAHYRRGQERTMTPSAAYLRAAADCVRSVAEQEGHDADAISAEIGPYLMWADSLDAEEAT